MKYNSRPEPPTKGIRDIWNANRRLKLIKQRNKLFKDVPKEYKQEKRQAKRDLRDATLYEISKRLQ